MCTPLHAACERVDNEPMVGLLCGLGADVQATTDSGFTPLHIAATVGNSAALRVLLEKGADSERLATHRITALTIAAQHNHAEAVAVLASSGANVNHTAEGGVAALHLAAIEGHTDVLHALAAAGADLEIETNSGITAMEFGALQGHIAIVQALCACGAAHSTARELAEEHGHREVATWLAKSLNYTTPLHYIDQVAPEQARTLLRAGANVHAGQETGSPTPVTLSRAAAHSGAAEEGSTPWLILRAAEPWSAGTHELFPAANRNRAHQLLILGYQIAYTRFQSSEGGAFIDVWRSAMLPYAISRGDAPSSKKVRSMAQRPCATALPKAGLEQGGAPLGS
jgi:hypothetical protein